MSRKGISFSIIPIIALIGVLGLSIWAGYQLSIGSSYRDVFIGISEEDEVIQKLELVKNMLTRDLSFSSIQAALDIAGNGGTESLTYWYCGYPIPPEPDEVEYAMSNVILDYLNAYVYTINEEDVLFEIEPTIPEYTCVGIFNPRESKCNKQDSRDCEKFATSAVAEPDSIIEIHEPVYVSDDDDLEAHIDDIRFYWIYYRLYNDFRLKDHSQYILPNIIPPGCKCYVLDNQGKLIEIDEYINKRWQELIDIGCVDNDRNPITPPPNPDCPAMIAEVQSDIDDKQANCVWGFLPGSIRPQIEQGLREICDHYNDIFDNYVTCNWKIECFSETKLECLSSECVRSANPEICDTAPKVYLQGSPEADIRESWSGSVRFRIILEDEKYKIPSEERDFQNLIWNINGALQWRYNDCPILVVVGGTEDDGSQQPPTPGY